MFNRRTAMKSLAFLSAIPLIPFASRGNARTAHVRDGETLVVFEGEEYDKIVVDEGGHMIAIGKCLIREANIAGSCRCIAQ